MRFSRARAVAIVLALASFMFSGTRALAQDIDAWPELEVRVPMNESLRLFVVTAFATDTRNSYAESAYGVALDQKLGPSWSIRGGLRTIGTQREASDQEELRFSADGTYWLKFGDRWLLTNRVRNDLRWIGGAFSFRLRDRPLLEYSAHVFNLNLRSYLSFEAWFDSRYPGLARDRWILGVAVPIGTRVVLDLFPEFQTNYQPSYSTEAAFGLKIGLLF